MNNYNPYYYQSSQAVYNPYTGQYSVGYDPFAPQRKEKKNIRRLSMVAGLCILGYILIQNILGIVIMLIPDANYLYTVSADFKNLMGIIFSVLGVLLPFALGSLYIKKHTDVKVTGYLEPASDKALALLLIPAGFMLCIAANYLTGFLTELIESTGFTLKEIEYSTPSTAWGWVIYFVEIAVVPPLCEEFAIRGAVLQPVRKYGEWFAIVTSSLVFAIMHGNLIQAPFAFICGMVLGFIAVKTNCLWACMAVHFLNNAFSVSIELLVGKVEDVFIQNVIYFSVLGVIGVAGIVCICILIEKYGKSLLVKSEKTSLPAGKKWKAFIFTIPMVFAIISLLIITAGYVEWTGGK